MGTPFYHTDESALETIQDYQNMHGLENIEDAIVDMEFCIDDLDNEDRGALNHYRRVNK